MGSATRLAYSVEVGGYAALVRIEHWLRPLMDHPKDFERRSTRVLHEALTATCTSFMMHPVMLFVNKGGL